MEETKKNDFTKQIIIKQNRIFKFPRKYNSDSKHDSKINIKSIIKPIYERN